MLTAEQRIRMMNETREEAARAGMAKIDAYWREYFAEEDEDEGSPHREDDHVSELGWERL